MLHIASLNTLDRASRWRVVANGRSNGLEHIKAYDLRSGWTHDCGGQSRSIVVVPDELDERLQDPFAELYIHHNHPDGGSFSRSDLMLALDVKNRARGKLFAHGHDDSTYGVAIANREQIVGLHRQAFDRAEHHLRHLISGRHVPVHVARSQFAHIVCQALDIAGVMHYEYAMSESRIDGWQRYADYLGEVVTAAADAVGR